ncbi:MAG: nitronate monooxygenase [Propionivibrio sp.]|uniref:NAD(P)H-dependent flavin oxidoreductase n=1 Tax=Propionivibrio sp. TaxID=2212460 RepID=UPI001A3E3FE7|nr:nitronate monooxygenase [Propionivibrio sp.]MBL8414011.1 nitronate monooxygenase [Propionivibrio sp.]
MSSVFLRTESFCHRFGVKLPILLAPMAGACAPSLSVAVMRAGGLGSCGALMMSPTEIVAWATKVHAGSDGPFQINLWIPDPVPMRDSGKEKAVRDFLAKWGPRVEPSAGDALPPDFSDQCNALLETAPPIVSSVMGLFPPEFVKQLKSRQIAWFANVSTLAEARAAEAAGADAIVAQGMEAGGHRGCFDQAAAERQMIGLFSLLPAIVDSVGIPVVATGGIADGRGVAAALALGASAAQIGTGFLRCPEANIHPAWAAALATTAPEDTMITRAFSGRAGRSIATAYVRAAAESAAPVPAPYPVQRGLTAAMRAESINTGDIERMQAWAGQSAALGRTQSAGAMVGELWDSACQFLA